MALHPWPRPSTNLRRLRRAEVEDLVRLREDAYLRVVLGKWRAFVFIIANLRYPEKNKFFAG